MTDPLVGLVLGLIAVAIIVWVAIFWEVSHYD